MLPPTPPYSHPPDQKTQTFFTRLAGRHVTPTKMERPDEPTPPSWGGIGYKSQSLTPCGCRGYAMTKRSEARWKHSARFTIKLAPFLPLGWHAPIVRACLCVQCHRGTKERRRHTHNIWVTLSSADISKQECGQDVLHFCGEGGRKTRIRHCGTGWGWNAEGKGLFGNDTVWFHFFFFLLIFKSGQRLFSLCLVHKVQQTPTKNNVKIFLFFFFLFFLRKIDWILSRSWNQCDNRLQKKI